MNVRSSYISEIRRLRDRRYRALLRTSGIISVLLHCALLIALSPMAAEFPLVRHIGYAGRLSLLPEISVLEEVDEKAREFEGASGRGSDSFLRVITFTFVDGETPPGSTVLEKTREPEHDEDAGEDILERLERSLPQPTSDEIVITRFVPPVYPQASLDSGVEGVVVFRLHVTKQGTVSRAWLLNSEVDPACEMAADAALSQWVFRPYLVDGRPTDILIDQRVRFQISRPPATRRASRP